MQLISRGLKRAVVTPVMPLPPKVPVALDKAYTLALWLIAKTEAMPRTHRFPDGSQYSELRRRRHLATLL